MLAFSGSTLEGLGNAVGSSITVSGKEKGVVSNGVWTVPETPIGEDTYTYLLLYPETCSYAIPLRNNNLNLVGISG